MHTLARVLALNAGAAKTLTASYATLDSQTVSHAGQMALDLIYTPGANTRNLSVKIEGSPHGSDVAEGSSEWFPLGIYTDSSGTWTEEVAVYTKAGATASTAYNCVPIEIPTTHQKIRVRVKEDGSSDFGTVKGWLNLASVS